MRNTYLSITIRPKSLFSSSYIFEKDTTKIGSIEYPLIAKMFSSNSASLYYENTEYQLVDSIAAITIGQSKYINTYLINRDVKIVELSYKNQRSPEEYIINYPEKSLEYLIKINGFGVWDIYLNEDKVGTLTNKEFFLRRACIELNQPVPFLVQFLIFWGSINSQD